MELEALFKISYGLYIVSAGNKTVGNGFISNSVFQVTSEPAKFAVCCNKDNYSATFIEKYKGFTVSILKQEASTDLIARFGYKSGKNFDKLAASKVEYTTSDAPVVVEDTIAWMEFSLKTSFDVGSHIIFIGELADARILDNNAEPLTYDYYRKFRKGMAPKNAPTYIDKSKLGKKAGEARLARYQCPACGYIYDPALGDPASGIKPGTAFESLPDTWVCPVCGTEKADFIKLDN